MAARHGDGIAGDADFGVIGTGYARYRQPEPRIAALILAALGDARTVLNVGAGSYEPIDHEVMAIEPSASMRAQRTALQNVRGERCERSVEPGQRNAPADR